MAANLGTLSYWESDASDVSRWGATKSSVPTAIYLYNLYPNATFYASNGIVEAVTQWNTALGCSMTAYVANANQTASQLIFYYAGAPSYINKLGIFPTVPDSYAGYTVNSSYNEGTWTYGSTTKTGSIITKSYGYIVDRAYSMAITENLFTHELGHALGWTGHSPTSTNVMYAVSSSNFTLTAADQRQLTQVYK
ncbi:MAG: matrixin family metalloprotease [Oscillospiraceae bacterium]|nr:matrixin family metalloprotease [Oscillospiraceae bacterium]